MAINVQVMDIQPGPDRSEFWRDMEACRRLHSPTAARRFAYSLITARVTQEIIEWDQSTRTKLSQWDADNYMAMNVRDLYRSAWEQGYFNVPIRCFKLNVVVS